MQREAAAAVSKSLASKSLVSKVPARKAHHRPATMEGKQRPEAAGSPGQSLQLINLN